MNNGLKSFVAVGALVLFGCMILGSKHAAYKTPSPKAAPAIVSYPIPVVDIQAQPLLASLNSENDPSQPESRSIDMRASYASDGIPSPRKHRHSHPKHKRVDPTIDGDMGYMAADDPKLLQAETDKSTSKKDDWKNWVPASNDGPDGR